VNALAAGTTVQLPFRGTETSVFLAIFVLVTVMGFGAARWRRAHDPRHLDEWGLGGRGFGSFVSWFLLGGDIFTAYTFIAVPGAMYATGAVSGWFAVAYTTIVWPIVFVVMPRLWSVSRRCGFVTPADFVRARFGSRSLALAVAVTGIVATMPYIALQLVGMQAVLEVMGIGTNSSNALVRDLPLILAFAILAAYTYTAGMRAPALIAFVKDILIYSVVLVCVIYLPMRLGGYGAIFDAAQTKFAAANAKAVAAGRPAPAAFVPGPRQLLAYGTLALGSAMALIVYPHTVTGVLATKNRRVIRRNSALLPLYSLLLAFLALTGYMAIAAGITTTNPRLAVPLLIEREFPHAFTGVAFAAVAVGALVPASIMSIAAANLFTRNIYVEFVRPGAAAAHQTAVAKLASLVVKVGAVVFVLAMDTQNSLNLQLLGGVWILQTFPAVVFGLWTRWLHRWGLLAGWLVGIGYGTYEAYRQTSAAAHHFGGSLAPVPGLGRTGYLALTAFVLNVAVAVLATVVLRALRAPDGADTTAPRPTDVDLAGQRAPQPAPGAARIA
jgi:SSS family solute:Na+ symporter